MRTISSPQLPPANGHYSQCIEHNGLLYLSGQLPLHPVTKVIPPTIQEQTQLVLSNIEIILNAAGVTKNQVIQARLYIANIELWSEINHQYMLFFEEHKPVRSIIPVPSLHFGCLLEVEVLAQAKP